MKILLLQKRLLFPANTGGKIRTLQIVRHLARWHDVTYLCGILPEEEPYQQQMRELGVRLITLPWSEAARGSARFYAELVANMLSHYPFSVQKDYDPLLQRAAKRLVREEPFDLVICDFVQMARNVPFGSDVPAILFQHNVEAQIYRRMADDERAVLKRWFIRIQQHKMQRFEAAVGRKFDGVVAVSQSDRQQFIREYGWTKVDVIDTAVDTDYFRPQASVPIAGRLVFVGSMDWLPNQAGVRRFVRSILPTIRQHHPDVTLDVVGRNPPASIRRLAQHPGVTVTGSVDDVRPYVAGAEIGIVPLYAGGGTRLKIFEMMAMGVPVVSTRIGAEGLEIEEGCHWLAADSDQEFSTAVSRLLADRELRRSLATAASDLVLQRYGSEVIARQFEKICQRVAATRERQY